LPCGRLNGRKAALIPARTLTAIAAAGTWQRISRTNSSGTWKWISPHWSTQASLHPSRDSRSFRGALKQERYRRRA